jgi:hypothetical protein
MSKLIKIDSRHAVSYYGPSTFLYQFDAITVEPHRCITYAIQNISIPFSYYGCNDHNNMLDLHEGNVVRSIGMPPGNYNAYQYASTLLSLLNSDAYIYALTYNPINNKYVITCNHDVALLFSTGPHAHQSNHLFLGFDDDVNLTANNSVSSSNACMMTDIQYLQIQSDLGSSNIVSGSNEDYLLDIIPINIQPNGYIQYSGNKPSFVYQDQCLNQIRIKLLDDSGREVDLNGLPFLIIVKIDIIDKEAHGIPYSLGRDEPAMNKTNLQTIMENPSIIKTAPPFNINDLIEAIIKTK